MGKPESVAPGIGQQTPDKPSLLNHGHTTNGNSCELEKRGIKQIEKLMNRPTGETRQRRLPDDTRLLEHVRTGEQEHAQVSKHCVLGNSGNRQSGEPSAPEEPGMWLWPPGETMRHVPACSATQQLQ